MKNNHNIVYTTFTLLLLMFNYGCRKSIKNENPVAVENEDLTIVKKESVLDFSKIDCDSLYDMFLSTEGSTAIITEDTLPRYYFLNYYKCLNYLEKGKLDSIVSEIEKFSYLFNEKDIIIGVKYHSEIGLDRSYLLDKEFNVLHKSMRIKPFYTDGITFSMEEANNSYYYYDEKLKKDIYRKMDFEFRIINKKGEYVNEEKYTDFLFWENGYFEVYKDDFKTGSAGEKVGLIDFTGEDVIPIEYRWIEKFSDHYIKAKKQVDDNIFKWGLINYKNEIIIPFNYIDYENLEYAAENYIYDNKSK